MRGERLFALHIRRSENRLYAGEVHQAPAGEVLIAAVNWVGEHAFHGVRAKRFSKKACAVGQVNSVVLPLLRVRRITSSLSRGVEPGEGWCCNSCGSNARRVLGKPASVEVLKIGVGSREREIDVVEHVRVAGSSFARCAGHEAFGKRGDGGSNT